MDDATLPPEDARAFWYGLIDYERRSPRRTDLKLDRMRRLLGRLGDPHERLRILHVAGSKGKGSTAAMLAAILGRAGYRTGLFTSPHLTCVEERFQVAGEPIGPAELNALLDEVRSACAAGRADAPTFFEVATVVGFLHFLRRRVDVAVIEVGLGGRLDSTNVCSPVASLITSISHDHTQQLGDRLASIAREKAGIVKPGRPCLSGATGPEARAVIEEVCRQRGAPLCQLGRDFHYEYEPGSVTPEEFRPPRMRLPAADGVGPWVEMGLLGEHQAANAAVAVACIEALRARDWTIPERAVAEGLARVRWPARLEVVGARPLVVLDCAHNVASAWALADTLRSCFLGPGRFQGQTWLLFAGSHDKDVPGMFRVLGTVFDHALLTRFTDNPRAISPEEVAVNWRAATDRPATLCPTPADAWRLVRSLAGPQDLICITGSVFLAGEMRPLVSPPVVDRGS
jgi:dihydrofolate synthase/folylpolyglutamate synthase